MQLKITGNMKKQKHLNSHGRRQPTDKNAEKTEMLGLSDKVVKAAI